MLCESFAPIAVPDARVLILGSMPGVMSLQKQQYYGHPRNHFWPIIFSVIDKPLPENYEARVQGLMDNKIALWDVLHYCHREGSLDSHIKNEVPNDFTDLLTKLPQLGLICFNGSKAAQMWKKHVNCSTEGLDFLLLPSTSPVPGKNIKTLQEKLVVWRVIANYLN